MSFFTKAVVKALQEFPDVNSMIDGDEIIHYDYQDISIAVSTPKGLMAPVVRNAEDLDFFGVENEIARLAKKQEMEKFQLMICWVVHLRLQMVVFLVQCFQLLLSILLNQQF